MKRGLRFKGFLITVGVLVFAYVLSAYVVLPAMWAHHEHQPSLAGRSAVTRTKQGIAGDALNVGLVGTHQDVIRAMSGAGWYPADPITLKSSIEIIGSVLLDRPDPGAPVSNLYYDGRKEDLAFERPDGSSADRRHHVRFWEVLKEGADGRPVWLGAATFDQSVGLSKYTGQVTHHTAPDIDAERSFLVDDLERAGMAKTVYQISGVGPTLNGRNGEGDRYYTDGEIWIVQLVTAGQKQERPPAVFAPPPLIQLKDAAWKNLKSVLGN